MNPSSTPEKKVAIIGGGITGLAAAYTLQEKARAAGLTVSYTLFESSPRLGGKIITDQQDGFTIEGGPDSFIAQKPYATDLARALGMESDLIGTNPKQKQLYVVQKGGLLPMPDGVMLIIPTRFMPFIISPLISWPGKIRMGLDLFIRARRDDEDETMGDFIRRRLGKEALDKIAEPLLSGIHVSDPEKQSIMATFPRLRNIEKKYGSLVVGMLAQKRQGSSNGKKPASSNGSNGAKPASSNGASYRSSFFISMRGGLMQLVDGIEKALTGEVRKGCAAQAISTRPEGGYRITTETGEVFDADAVILTSPAFVSSDLVSSFAPELSSALLEIPYVSTAVVSIAYRQADLKKPVNGTGFIIPKGEKRRITACTFTSNKYAYRAPEEYLMVRCFVGGPGHEAEVERSEEEIIATVQSELKGIVGIQAEPCLAKVYKWVKGNPQYNVGHLERVSHLHELCAQLPGVTIAGGAYDGVGVPDCVHQGQQAAEKVLSYLQQ